MQRRKTANSTNGYVYDLSGGRTYYFKVRTYIKTDSGYVYSAWSDVESVKINVTYYVTKSGTKYHVESQIEISYKDAVAKGYTACNNCIG